MIFLRLYGFLVDCFFYFLLLSAFIGPVSLIYYNRRSK